MDKVRKDKLVLCRNDFLVMGMCSMWTLSCHENLGAREKEVWNTIKHILTTMGANVRKNCLSDLRKFILVNLPKLGCF